jgi:undecaprenyl diphosphate synthase
VWKKWFSKSRNDANNEIYDSVDMSRIPKHIAIIMDGNGRWAQKRGLLRTFGHKAGAETLRAIVQTVSELGVQVLTAYAFSTENWKRPNDEVSLLMNLLSEYLDNEIDELCDNNVQIRFIGKIDELAPMLQHKIEKAQTRTAQNSGLVLNLAVNYGGRAEITRAVQIISDKVAQGQLCPNEINENVINNYLYTKDLPDPDLLIRPSGDFRVSNFLLWQLAYTEFYFTDLYWPDFKPDHLIQAIAAYQNRDRRFGGLNNSKPRNTK